MGVIAAHFYWQKQQSLASNCSSDGEYDTLEAKSVAAVAVAVALLLGAVALSSNIGTDERMYATREMLALSMLLPLLYIHTPAK